MEYKYWSDIGNYTGDGELERFLFDRPMTTYMSIYRDYLIGDTLEDIAERRGIGTGEVADMFNSPAFNEVIDRFTEENEGKSMQELLTEAGAERAIRRLLVVLDNPDIDAKDAISAAKTIAVDFAGLTVGKKQSDGGQNDSTAPMLTFNLQGATPPGLGVEMSDVLAINRRRNPPDIVDV